MGGLVFGFSPYMIAQLLGHVVLVMVFPIPIAIYLVVRRMEGSLRRLWFVILLGITLAAQFLLELEPLALMLMVGGCAILIALRGATVETRARLFQLLPEIAAAGALTAFVVSPYLYFFFASGFPTQPLWSSSMFSSDLLNFVVPTSANAAGNLTPFAKVSQSFTGDIFEQDAFLGIPLIAIAVVWGMRHKASQTLLCPLNNEINPGISAVVISGSKIPLSNRSWGTPRFSTWR